ncbi:hypothetical protein AZ78_4668 [Lysobacter capsici AZ78]|uniref:Uncharacterized protein n=1 Tax=Lysobacter capsici AZ78 TaxID=1444315 RepID=A0A108UDA4_9GAMM|nr:hypothetical protein AZ78_4668 [Lysobacter capsici AZ78]
MRPHRSHRGAQQRGGPYSVTTHAIPLPFDGRPTMAQAPGAGFALRGSPTGRRGDAGL